MGLLFDENSHVQIGLYHDLFSPFIIPKGISFYPTMGPFETCLVVYHCFTSFNSKTEGNLANSRRVLSFEEVGQKAVFNKLPHFSAFFHLQ